MAISSALGSSALLPAGLGFRNKIINGDMTVNQRGYTSASPVSVSTGSQVYYSVDRWYGSGETSQGVYSLGQSTTVPSSETFINSLVATCTTADASLAATDDYEFGQAIEGFNASSLGYGTSAAKQSVLSFWVRSSLIGTYCVALRNSASNRSYIAEYTINVADTWEKKTIYINGDTTGTWLKNTSTGINITWALAVGSTYQTAAGSWTAGNYLCSSNQVNWMSSSTSRTFYITGVQLEQNSQPTPFEQRPIGVELTLCQRYFQRFSGETFGQMATGLFNATTIAGSLYRYLGTPLRITAHTLEYSNLRMSDFQSAFTVSSLTFVAQRNCKEVPVFEFSTSGGTAFRPLILEANNNASGFISFSAEL
jgi:hypothetical protein